MDFQVLMRSSDRRLLIESCIKFYAKELNIENHNFNLIVEPINLREIRSADGSVTELIKKKKHSVKKEKKLISK